MPASRRIDSAKLIRTASLLRSNSCIRDPDNRSLDLFLAGWMGGCVAPIGLDPSSLPAIPRATELRADSTTWAWSSHSKRREIPQRASSRCSTSLPRICEAVNRIILDKAVSDVELIPTLAHHLIDSGGKRLRPMLTHRRLQAVRLSAAAAISASRPRSSSCIRPRCCTTTSSTRATTARQEVGAHAVGQSGQRAGRRLPARPGVPHDGRRRLAAGAQDPVERRRR